MIKYLAVKSKHVQHLYSISENFNHLRTVVGDDSEGVTGLKALGVRDLNYRMAFLACSITPTNPKVRFLL